MTATNLSKAARSTPGLAENLNIKSWWHFPSLNALADSQTMHLLIHDAAAVASDEHGKDLVVMCLATTELLSSWREQLSEF